MHRSGRESAHTPANESGAVLVVLIAAVVPLMLFVMASTTTMNQRNRQLVFDVSQTKALLAAEAGIDAALFRSQAGNLHHEVSFARELANGFGFEVSPVHLMSDGTDNDGDGDVDENDENVFEVTSTGTFAHSTRRVVAYFGPLPDLPNIQGSVTVSNPNVIIDIANRLGFDPYVTGIDTNLDGSLGGQDIEGLAIEDPGTVTHLLDEMTAYEELRVHGVGTAPSVRMTDNGYDFDAIALQAQNTANIVLTTTTHHDVDWGDSSTGDFNIVYRDGDVEVFGGRGAGILVATGQIELEDGFRWDGLVISTHGSELELESDAGLGKVIVYGAVVVGPDCEELELEGDVEIRYCSEVLQQIGLLVPSSRYVTFNGWQEVSAN